MKKLREKLVAAQVRAQLCWRDFTDDESGMEVIQVLVLLAIGLGLVILFATLGDKIVSAVSEKVEAFLKFLKGR